MGEDFGKVTMRRRLLWALKWVLLLIVALRCVGMAARMVRDNHLEYMLRQGVDTLQEAGFTVFLDWSSLLGQWREGGFLQDEEDCDLAVVVPEGSDEAHVARVLASAFKPADHMKIIIEQGAVYAEPMYNRLHLDLYLVRQQGEQLIPMWPPPTRTDSHAAFIYPRPFTGISQLHGWPVPTNTEGYLGSLFGYLGTGATYSAETGLYHKSNSTQIPSVSDRLSKHVGAFSYQLGRDFYFVALMAPLSQAFRKSVEQQFDGVVKWALSFICKGSPETVSLRDC